MCIAKKKYRQKYRRVSAFGNVEFFLVLKINILFDVRQN